MELLEGTTEVLDVFTKEFVGRRDVILGISGGIDSALVAYILKKNISRDKIHLYSLPFGKESKDVKRVSEFLDLKYENVDMSDALIFFSRISRSEKVTGNVKARLRMIYLYSKANEYRGLVAGTSNKSELLTGYFTKFGDGGSDFQVLGDLYKTQVYEIAKRYRFPQWLLEKPPSADLWAGQTDEGELGISYEKLDRILECLEYLKTPEQCKVEGCNLQEVKKIYTMVSDSAHKRVNFYIPKVSFRSVGTDWME
ncbi:MAG: NAD(+) synthase [Thermoplasmatales archaeon]|nr:NAD(+) synthase [Candidatus Thermoplasmatota archaeon]MCL6002833.1 NAD(+) synthase [Candidatus Thermoplasmatota archaeon]MDA8054305.1 NAD(+) synthase [Thermoplasmatales archaeon]